MKKMIALILAFAMSFACIGGATVSATEYAYMSEEEQYGYGEIAATHHSGSTFELEIPLTADSAAENSIVATNPNLEDGYRIEVYVTNLAADGTIDFYHTSGDHAGLTLYDDTDGRRLTFDDPMLASFAAEDFDSEGTASSMFSIRGGNVYTMKAGTYTGTICYRVECNPVSE